MTCTTHITQPRPSCMTPEYAMTLRIGRLTPFVTEAFRHVRVTKRVYHLPHSQRVNFKLEYLAQKAVVNTPAEAVKVIQAWRDVQVIEGEMRQLELPLEDVA